MDTYTLGVLIPLGTNRPLRRLPLVTWGLLVVNLVIFLISSGMDRMNPEGYEAMLRQYHLAGDSPIWWTYLSYQFLHADFWHVFGNMMVLWVFGPNVEDRFGKIGFTLFYLIGGVAAGAMHVLFEHSPVIGASGSIAAVTGAFLVLFPRTEIKCLIFFYFIGIYELAAWWFIGFAVFRDIIMQGLSHGHQIAYLAHIGGYAMGIGVSLFLLVTKIVPREGLDLFSIMAHKKRLYDIRGAAEIAEREYQKRQAAITPEQRKVMESMASIRARLTERISANDATGTLEDYKELSRLAAGEKRATLMPRRVQYDLGNLLFAGGHHAEAADVYELFVDAYADDHEATRVRLMLALTCTRYLGQNSRARIAMNDVKMDFADPEMRQIADLVRQTLGAEAPVNAPSPQR